MNITAELPFWLFLVLCCCYSTVSLFVYYILSNLFEKNGLMADWKFFLIYMGSVMWPIGLIFVIFIVLAMETGMFEYDQIILNMPHK